MTCLLISEDAFFRMTKLIPLLHQQAETELSVLGSLPRQPRETTERINYLLNKLQTSHSKIAGFEKDMAALKKVLAQEA